MKPKPLRRPATRKSLCRRADRDFAVLVKARDGGCRMAGVMARFKLDNAPWFGLNCAGRLECCHIVPRRVFSLRWTPDNGIALCQSHHRWFDTEGVSRWTWVIQELGQERYDALMAARLPKWDGDYDRVFRELRAWKEELAA